MYERYTTDVPAVPDPEYVYVNPEYKRDILERAEDEGVEIPDTLKYLFESIEEVKQSGVAKNYDSWAESVFETRGAQNFIDSVAIYDFDGRLNLDRTSSNIGIPYNFNMSDSFSLGEIIGLRNSGTVDEPIEIHLAPRKSYHQQTFGHEIGHYYWNEILRYDRGGRDEENFCEYFGRRMALPDDYLAEYGHIDEAVLLEIMSRFRVELHDVMRGLMETGKLPGRVAVDTYNGKLPNEDYSEKVTRGVFCLHCMQVGGDYNCPDVDHRTPLFDLTDRAWGGQMGHCLGEDTHRAEIMSTLTKYYVAHEVQLVLFRPGDDYFDVPEIDVA